ncbi:hypothetical protein DFH09DRAFT_1397490 [Mycena vulgaris]|nr:hypothetical protein DFH09DRAFT_1397490 [Mycena vulgaris]
MTNYSTRDRSRTLASPGDILPVELWELIFRHIEFDPELLHLARVCSAFNAVSIRLLLARHGQGQDVFDCTDLQLSVYTLPVLYLSLRSFSATRVTCSFDRAETRWNIHLLDALLTRTPNLRRLDLEFNHDLLGGLACVNRAFRDMVVSVVHRTTGPVFIFLADEIFSCWPHDVDTWDLQHSLFMSPDLGTKTGTWVKRIRERFGRKRVPTESTTGKILLHTGDIVDMKRLSSLRAVSIQLVNKDPSCALLILNPGEVDTICLGRLYGANIPAVDLGCALVDVALPSLRHVIIRTDKVNPTALRTFLANHPQVSDIKYDVPDGVLTSTNKLIDPPLAHPALALFRSATNALGFARVLCGLQDSPNLYEFAFSFPGTLRPEQFALLLEDLRLVAVRTRDTKLTLGVWEPQHLAQPVKLWASEEEAREVARTMRAVHVCLIKTSTIQDAREMFPWLAQLPSAAEIQFEIHEDFPYMDDIPSGFNPQEGIPEFLEEARAALASVLEVEDARANGHGPSQVSQSIGNDMDMHAEIARLWQGENLDRVGKSLKEALRISEASGQPDPRLLNNLGALQQFDGNLADARELYESALTSTATLGTEVAEAMSTSILYNLARVYEEEGRDDLVKDAYEKLLLRHPEYVDPKIRQAQMLANLNRHNDAHELLKQALAAQNSNLNVRAFYTYFLIQANLPKPAKDFVFATLNDHDKHDVYSLCSAGWIMYHQSRESRDTSSKGTEERRRGFQRSAEFYEKALQLDPLCAFAAQGLAIVTAEDGLGALSGVAPVGSSADEAQKRLKNAREALNVFAKVRESINGGSVYFNIGHCYYARDEFDRAIESVKTASTRFYAGHNVPVLLCLCRSWYAKATKDQSFTVMSTALRYAQMALHIQPNDKAVVYNIAMLQQKSAEMLFSLPTTKRTLKDLKRSTEQANNAQKLFASLASDKASMVPYSREIVDQRRRYGDTILRKSEEHLATQKQYEAEVQAKLDTARQKRQEERDRQGALERARMEELRKEAEQLAEQRKLTREQALEWTREVRMESDEEKERKPKKARKQKTDGSGDEAEPKKKRRGKLKRGGDQEEGAEEPAIFSDDEDVERPKKRVTKKRVIRDDDDEEVVGPRKKQFKSREMLSDTDDEMS